MSLFSEILANLTFIWEGALMGFLALQSLTGVLLWKKAYLALCENNTFGYVQNPKAAG